MLTVWWAPLQDLAIHQGTKAPRNSFPRGTYVLGTVRRTKVKQDREWVSCGGYFKQLGQGGLAGKVGAQSGCWMTE